MEPFSVVLYQNDPRTAQTLAVSLSRHFDSVYLAGTYQDVLPAVARHRAEAVVLDLETSGPGEVERLHHEYPDLCIVGTDRTTATGDVCNKIGTYLKALAAHDNRLPFYVALPSSTIDWTIEDGVEEIPIEQRAPDEVAKVTGKAADGSLQTVQVVPDGAPVANYGFDVTPARLVTALITERGVCKATADDLASLFPQRGT